MGLLLVLIHNRFEVGWARGVLLLVGGLKGEVDTKAGWRWDDLLQDRGSRFR